MAGVSTFGSVSPAVPAAGKGKKPMPGKKGVNPFAKKGAAPAPAAGKPMPGKAGPIDPKTLGSMKGSLKSM